jgi:MFS transporter, PAT family, solute carrier family 33 (acetyl-CoA transportor), member 1
MHAYKIRVTIVPIVDCLMLMSLRNGEPLDVFGKFVYWSLIFFSTALQTTVSSLQFNAQMTFFAKRVDPAIGGSYMTLLNTAANLGGTWPASLIMWLMSLLSRDPQCEITNSGAELCKPGREPFFVLQAASSILGCLWIHFLGAKVKELAELSDEAWRTNLLCVKEDISDAEIHSEDVELGEVRVVELSHSKVS